MPAGGALARPTPNHNPSDVTQVVEKPGSTGWKGYPAPRFECCLRPCSLRKPDQLLQGQRWSQVEPSLQESQGKLRLAITQGWQALGAYSGRRMGLRWPSTMTARKQHQDLPLFVLPTRTSEHPWHGSCGTCCTHSSSRQVQGALRGWPWCRSFTDPAGPWGRGGAPILLGMSPQSRTDKCEMLNYSQSQDCIFSLVLWILFGSHGIIEREG